ncbi:MAG: SGNH/GDSL hydrolase family protein [Dehalococcoidia bacterium]
MAPEVVLLGDSIFDNGAYVGGGPDVGQQVEERLPPDWGVTPLAVDGNVTSDVHTQLERLPSSATHLVISTGGNDALNLMDLLGQSAHSFSQVLSTLGEVAAQFRATYHGLLLEVLSRQLPTVICTIYYPAFDDPDLQRVSSAGLTFFNDVILLEAIQNQVPVLDLRSIFTEKHHYANPIEPSESGGAKLADSIRRLVLEHDFSEPTCQIYV